MDRTDSPSRNAKPERLPQQGPTISGIEATRLTPAGAAQGESAEDDRRDAFLASGWTQGAVLPESLSRRVQFVPGGSTPSDDAKWLQTVWCIVVTQDCDLVCGSLKMEPVVEVVLAQRLTKTKQRYKFLRNPRELHLTLVRADATVQPVKVRVLNRGYLPREALLQERPVEGIRADARATEQLAGLLSRRYVRVARPDAFDARFRPAKAALETLLEQRREILLDVLLRIVPLDRECEPGTPYQLEVYAVLQDAYDDRPKSETRAEIDALRQDIWNAVAQCEDIELEAVHVRGRADISIREREGLRSVDLVWPQYAAWEEDTRDEDDA